MWMEMSRDNDHGGGSWGFTKCLWSPTRKRAGEDSESGGRWSFWENLLKVNAGNQILHLRSERDTAAFVGFSTAETDGYKTLERPPSSGQWSYATEFYRVLLKDFTPFPTPILLKDVFKREDAALRIYFAGNKVKPVGQKKSVFYVIQANRLQCLNGAYLSEVDDELATILLNTSYSTAQPSTVTSGSSSGGLVYPTPSARVDTGMRIRELGVRDGQQKFSANVRANYESRCAFPGCSIDEGSMLVGAHIARWTDVLELRGVTSNGICWCLNHDKAFEIGLFTVGRDLRVAVNTNHPLVSKSEWCRNSLLPYDGQPIREALIPPSEEALQHHWNRIGYAPPDSDE